MELLDDDWVAVRHDVPNIIASKYNDFVDAPGSLGDEQIEVLVDESARCILLFYFCEKNGEVKKFETRFQVDSLSTLHFQMKNMIENFDVDPPSLAIATEYSGNSGKQINNLKKFSKRIFDPLKRYKDTSISLSSHYLPL